MGNKLNAIHIGDPLCYLFNNINLCIYPINFMDFFPMLKSRISTMKIIDNLENIININDYNYGIIRNAFFGTIPATYYVKENSSLIFMDEAIKIGLIPKAINTTTVITRSNKERHHYTFNELNSIPIEVNGGSSVFHTILEEENLSIQITRLFSSMDPYSVLPDIYEFLKIASSLNITDGIVLKILYHPQVNPLLASISLQNEELVTKYLRMVDPRSNNFQAYILSTPNTNINNSVKYGIIRKNLLIKEVLIIMLNVFGEEIYCYMCSTEMFII